MIPFCKTDLGEEEIKAVGDCIRSGWVVMGPKTQEFEEKFAEYVGAKYAVFVDSGTSALFLALKRLEKLGHKTEITVPSLTFTATAEVCVNAGWKVRFGEVGEDFCLETVNAGTLPVHLTGNRAKNGALIYDSAHRIEKDDVKDSAALWCYSFYATKNITTVQGGMIATNNKDDYEWLKKARDHGLDMGTKERYVGKYKQYDVQFVGYRVKGDDMRAVVGLEQLKKLPKLTERRNELVAKYNRELGLDRKGNHVYPVLVKDRELFTDFMFENGIQTAVHFRPLHTMTGYKKIPCDNLKNTEFIGEHIVSLPLFPQLTNEEQDYIISKVLETNLLI